MRGGHRRRRGQRVVPVGAELGGRCVGGRGRTRAEHQTGGQGEAAEHGHDPSSSHGKGVKRGRGPRRQTPYADLGGLCAPTRKNQLISAHPERRTLHASNHSNRGLLGRHADSRSSLSDPGEPDVRSGPRFLYWLGRNQLGGQLKSLAWGLLHQCGIAGLPLTVGLAVQAAVDRSGSRLALAGALNVLLGAAIALGDTMLHRTAVTNWITAAARVQQLLARKTAELGSALTRRVAAGEVVAVSTGDVEKIGWFVEALSRFAAARRRPRDHLRRPGDLPARPRRRRRHRRARTGPGRPAVAAARHQARRHPARKGGPGNGVGVGHGRRAAGAARHRRRGAVPRPLPRGLPGGPPGRRAQRPHVVADLGGPGAAAGSAAHHGGLVRRAARP